MMKKLKIMTVIGTRLEIIRLSAVIHKLEDSEAIEHVLVHTGQIIMSYTDYVKRVVWGK